MQKALFFDAASTTPIDPRVEEAMVNAREYWGNENSKHAAGFEARKVFDRHVASIADILGVSPDHLAITYSGTDSNRRVIHAVAKRVGLEHCYASAVEHSSILDELPEGHTLDTGNEKLKIKNEKLRNFSDGDPRFVAVVGANSETGTMYEGEEVRQRYPEALILRDYAQSYAKGVKPDLAYADFGSFSPQKIYGPKMVGLLYLKDPQNFQEISKDSHTKSVPLVAGMAKAFELHHQESSQYLQDIERWDDQICSFIRERIPEIKFHEEGKERLKGLLNVAFLGVRGGELMTRLSEAEGICVSTGSACTSDIMSPTTVIKHIEPDARWQYPIRIGLHKYLTDEAVAHFCEVLEHYVGEMRGGGN